MNINSNKSSPFIAQYHPNEYLVHQDEFDFIRNIIIEQFKNDPIIQKKMQEVHNLFPVTKRKLANGVTIFFLHRKISNTNEPSNVTIQALIKTGFLAESIKERGLAHMTEHCVLLGSKNFSEKEIRKKVEEYGNTVGRDSNATTSVDWTLYFFNNISSKDPEVIKTFLNMLREILFEPSFPEKQVLNERHVIKQEYAYRNSYNLRNIKHYFQKIYPDEIICRYLEEDLKNIEDHELVDQVRAFHKKWYQPHNLGLILVGDFENNKNFEEILAFVEDKFGKIPSASEQGIPEYVFLKPNFPERENRIIESVFEDVQHSSPKIQIQYRIPHYQPISALFENSKFYQHYNFHDVIQSAYQYIFGKIIEKRFKTEIKKFKGSIVNFSLVCNKRNEAKNFQFISINLEAREGKVKEAYQQYLTIFKEYISYGISEDQFNRAKKLLKRDLERTFSENVVTNQLLAQRIQIIFKQNLKIENLLGETAFALHILDFLKPSHLKEIISQMDVITKVETETNHILNLAPQAKKFECSSLQKVRDEVRNLSVQPYTCMNLGVCLPKISTCVLPQLVEILNVKHPSKNLRLELHSLYFPNGINAILAPIQSLDSRIHFTLFNSDKNLNITNRKERIALDLAFECLESMGLKDKSFDETFHSLDNENISYFSPKRTDEGWSISSSFTKHEHDIEKFLQIIHARLTDFQNIDSTEFKEKFTELQEIKEELFSKYDETVSGKIANQFNDMLYEDEYYKFISGKEYRDDGLYELGKKLIKEVLQDLDQATFIVCGPFDLDKTLPLIHSYIGSLTPKPMEKTSVPPFVFPQKKECNLPVEISNKKTLTVCYPFPIWDGKNKNQKAMIACDVIFQYLKIKLRFDNQKTYQFSMNIHYLPVGEEGILKFSLISDAVQYESTKDSVFNDIKNLSKKLNDIDNNPDLKKELSDVLKNIQDADKNYVNKNMPYSDFWSNKIENSIDNIDELFEIIEEMDWIESLQIEDLLEYLITICNGDEKRSITLVTSPKVDG